jgi:hypothetical protein
LGVVNRIKDKFVMGLNCLPEFGPTARVMWLAGVEQFTWETCLEHNIAATPEVESATCHPKIQCLILAAKRGT